MQFLKSVLAGSLVCLPAITSLILNSSAQEVPEPPNPPDLSENAVQAVKSWKFEPGSKDGKPVAVEIAVEVQFRLNQ